MKKNFCAALLALLLVPSVTLAQNFHAGLEASQAGDYETALKEWKPLAKQGRAGVMMLVGGFYEDGKGVPQDYIAAHMWYNLAGVRGLEGGRKYRDELAQKMTAEDISEAQRRARICMESSYQNCD